VIDFAHRGWRGDGSEPSYLTSECGLCLRHLSHMQYHRCLLIVGWGRNRVRQESRARYVRLYGLTWWRDRQRASKVRPVTRQVYWWEALSVEERVEAMRSGRMSWRECATWASRYPEQVPLLNGEFEYIARTME
jgi:hypothetical protein